MAKQPNITQVNSLNGITTTINANFNNIAEAFENTLSRDGSTPNQMEADIDLNSNDLLNVKDIDITGNLIVDGTSLNEQVANAAASAELAEAWADSETPPDGPGTQSARIGAEVSVFSALAAQAAAESLEAELFGPRPDLVAWVDEGNIPEDGKEYRAGGLSYLGSTGASITGMPAGLIPSGVVSTDHFDTLEDALTWIASTGGEMTLPSRRTTLTSGLTLPKLGVGGKRVILRGSGPTSELYFSTGTGNLIYAGDPTVQGGALGWELRDFKITGAGTGVGTGIYLERANSARIHNITFDSMQDAIGTSETFGLRVTNCHVGSLGRDFIRCDTRIFHLVVDKTNAFNIGGYFINFQDAVSQALNVRITNNDVEVCGGLIQSVVGIAGLSYQGNYMEQATGTMFDFGSSVYGDISGGNTFQLSDAQPIDNFHGRFTGNHVVETQFTWGSSSFPCAVGNNAFGASGSVEAKPVKLPTVGTAYMVQSFYEQASYSKDDTGRVFLNGNLTRDTGVAAPTFPYLLFTLESGYRPDSPQTFITQGTTTGSAKIRVTAAGEVYIDANSTNDLGLGGINFMIA